MALYRRLFSNLRLTLVVHKPLSLFGARSMSSSSTSVSPQWSAGTEESFKEEALRLLQDGKWTLSATRMGLERKFEFKTFKTTMVCTPREVGGVEHRVLGWLTQVGGVNADIHQPSCRPV